MRWKRLAWVPLGAATAGLLVLATPLNALLSQPLRDLQLRALAPRQPAKGVFVFDIDESSLRDLKPELGSWPFRRDVYALAVERLRDAGARAIAIDVLLVDSHDGDGALARTIARPGAPVVLAAAGQLIVSDRALPPSPGVSSTTPALHWPSMQLPAETVWPAPDRPPLIGVITTPLDEDGRLRTLPLWHESQGRRWPALALAVRLAEGAAEPSASWRDGEGRIAVAYPTAAAAPKTWPFSRLARVTLDKDAVAALGRELRDSVVFIGSSALQATPVWTVSGPLSGTAALAQTYAALRDGELLQPTALWAAPALVGLALLPALVVWHRGRVRLARDAASTLAAAAVVLAAAAALLFGARMACDLGPALITLVAALAMMLLARELEQRGEHQRLAYERALAAEANRAKSDFLAGVSHELRTPLNALLGVAELLAETPLNEAQRRHVQVFRESGRLLHALINDLLDLSKIEAGRLDLETAVFPVRVLLRQLEQMLAPRAQIKGLALIVECDADVPEGVCGDMRRLEQALANLLGNAIKFTAVGSVKLSLRRDRGPDSMLAFEVADTGIGIAVDKLGSIFEPYIQAEGSIARQFGGTGLGLSIARGIAHLMGGEITVRSQPGRGSVFTLRVPLPAAVIPAAAATVAAAAPSWAPTVLLAEDHEVNVYLFRARREGATRRIDVATDGLMALELAGRPGYDIAFIDVQMPGMDGWTVTREVRRLEAKSGLPRLPIIALTANAYPEDVQNSLEAGCDRHLTKPFTREQLLDCIARFAPAASPLAPPPATGAVAGRS